jgi:hypothetical protein
VLTRTVTAIGILGVGSTAVGLLTGCTADSSGSKPNRPARRDPALEILGTVLASERALLADYQQVLAAHPSLGTQLAGLLADHQAHEKALSTLLVQRNSRAGISSPPASSSPSVEFSRSPNASITEGSSSAVRYLSEAESTATTTAVTACLAADADLATLLASIAACESSHQVILR